MIKKLFILFSVLLLIYMAWPGPSRIAQFPPLPNSVKSTLEGDTIQIPNVSAYFSDNFREFVVPFYSSEYQKLSKFPLPPLKLNHPPEYSWIAIKKHTDSTYLEELVYPLKSTLFVNGLEPFTYTGEPRWWGATKFEVEGKSLLTKTTLRFYPSPLFVRFLVWAGIVISVFLLYKMSKKIIFKL